MIVTVGILTSNPRDANYLKGNINQNLINSQKKQDNGLLLTELICTVTIHAIQHYLYLVIDSILFLLYYY